jgi:hypothetical protein
VIDGSDPCLLLASQFESFIDPFAMLPLVFALGPGTELRASLAQAVIGGADLDRSAGGLHTAG